MELYIGMDVSLKETSICVVDSSGEIVFEGTVISESAAIAAFIEAKAVSALRIGLETGPTTTWHELRALGLPSRFPGNWVLTATATLNVTVNPTTLDFSGMETDSIFRNDPFLCTDFAACTLISVIVAIRLSEFSASALESNSPTAGFTGFISLMVNQ